MAEPSAERVAGRLLVATPDLRDPNFVRTVVLVLEHGDEGALGVVLNRPTGTEVGDVLRGWETLGAPPAVVFVGGPVQPTAVIGLAAVAAPGETGIVRPLDGDRLVGLATVDLDADAALAAAEVARVRVFAGYAGWSAGQLDAELEAGGWFVVDAQPGDPFTGDPDALWRTVLARQHGRLAIFATCPEDPSTN